MHKFTEVIIHSGSLGQLLIVFFILALIVNILLLFDTFILKSKTQMTLGTATMAFSPLIAFGGLASLSGRIQTFSAAASAEPELLEVLLQEGFSRSNFLFRYAIVFFTISLFLFVINQYLNNRFTTFKSHQRINISSRLNGVLMGISIYASLGSAASIGFIFISKMTGSPLIKLFPFIILLMIGFIEFFFLLKRKTTLGHALLHNHLKSIDGSEASAFKVLLWFLLAYVLGPLNLIFALFTKGIFLNDKVLKLKIYTHSLKPKARPIIFFTLLTISVGLLSPMALYLQMRTSITEQIMAEQEVEYGTAEFKTIFEEKFKNYRKLIFSY